MAEEKKVKIKLAHCHEISNVKYGPGEVEVEEALASTLLYKDQLEGNKGAK